MKGDTMNKKIMVIALIGLSFLIAGCQQEDQNNGTSFIGGQEGLDISFMDQAPPDQVADQGDQSFDVVVELQNQGEAEIQPEDVLVELKGFSPDDFGKSIEDLTKNANDTIQANEQVPGEDRVIDSPPVFVEFTDFIYEGAAQTNLDYTMQADVCYSYETQVAASLCIGENLNRPDLNDICSLTRQENPPNSGAPVQVTDFSQSPGGSDAVRFSFTVQNTNAENGEVYRTNSQCEEDRSNSDQVFVQVSGLESTGEVSCTGLREGTSSSGFTRLGNNQETEVHCSLEIPESNRNDRLENFVIEVGYDYLESVQKQVQVRNTLTG